MKFAQFHATAPAEAELLQLLRQLVDDVRSIRDMLSAERPAISASDDSAGNLLQAIGETTQGLKFTVSELLEHAEVVAGRAGDQRLHDAIVAACGAVNGRRLGKRLGRLEGRAIDRLRVVRVGVGRDGIAWRVVAGLRV